MEDTRIPPTKPHFFKPLINPNFRNEILIPISFFIKFLDNGQTCEKAILRSGRGKVWPVNLDGRRVVEGWPKFVEDHDLHIGDFLVFRHEGNMVFDVIIFDPSACEREYPPFDIIDKENERSNPGKDSNGLGGYSMAGQEMTSNAIPSSSTPKHSYFCGIIKPYNLTNHKLNIPMNFARSNGLVNKFCKMILRNEKGGSWQLLLRHKKRDGIVYIGGGWTAFVVENGLEVGDEFKLELVKGGKMLIMNYYGIN